MSTIIHRELSDRVIGACFRVHSQLGSFLPEHCYHRALMIEFSKCDISYSSQHRYEVDYDEQRVGHFIADLVIEDKIILELKSAESITDNHKAQVFTYLRLSGIHLGYVINFGARSMQFKRLIM